MKLRIITTLLLALMAFAACGSSPAATPEPAATDAAPPVSTPTSAPTDTPVPSPTPLPTDTPLPASLTPSEIFDQVAPSVAFVETGRGTGSGFLIDDGYLVTNAHVVWPFTSVRVVFPDGSEFENTPVLATDLIGDLAVLGPIETDLSPVSFLTDERLVIGKDVYLIGYPGEVEDFPQPTISRGLVSRLRNWPAIDMTYLQTDAAIAGGQSGGVLVSDQGKVAGISGNSFAQTSFALVASATDVMERVDALVAGEKVDGLGKRPMLDDQAADNRHMVVMPFSYSGLPYGLRGKEGDTVVIDFESVGDFVITVTDPFGYYAAFADDTTSGKERAEFEIEDEGMYLVSVYQLDGVSSIGTISSTAVLTPLIDFDDSTRPVLNDSIPGNIDYEDDVDAFRIYLKKGQEINVLVESVMIDPAISIDLVDIGDDDLNLPHDDDSGKGLFGTDAEMSYRAPEDGIYNLIVESATGYETGGYYLSVDKVEPGDPTPMAPDPTPTPIHSAMGTATRYESSGTPRFRIDHPSDWQTVSSSSPLVATCNLVEYCRVAEGGNVVLLIDEERLSDLNMGSMTLEEYTNLTLEVLKARAETLKVVQSKEVVNKHGIPVQYLEFEFPSGVLRYLRIMYVYEGTAFNATLLMPAVSPDADDTARQVVEGLQRRLDQTFQYMIDSFEVVD
ncbi:MAG: trypsin-like peptidase domain-containing protein [Anaerolineae bacterium]|nr:trypsin-like peptidase domain-containing protein [Anaerolineae bacterium]MCB0205897.1 trypsin-like peptidase domain-containing protein [Anaerolineae bacterium]MCB0255640.1 trypsin-like peptidase domain-containing protein [Anaerolineae bacterium]